MAVNEMVAYGYARERILAELEACELLCANCHAREHRSLLADGTRRGPPTVRSSAGKPRTREAIRRWTRRYRAREGCRDCALADPRCLQFHHPDEASKAAGVGRLVSDGGSFGEVRREVEKSAVLCANCHRKAHRSPPDGP